jgi:hypothetical protein
MVEHEDSATAVQRLHQELVARPGDNELRIQLARAIRQMTLDSLATTVHQVRVIASAQQRELCRDAATRIIELAPWDGELQAFANGLSAEVEQGGRWIWERKPLAYTLVACCIVIGLAMAVVGGLTGNVALVVAAGILSSAALAGVVLAFRRQAWRITAREARPHLAHAGI